MIPVEFYVAESRTNKHKAKKKGSATAARINNMKGKKAGKAKTAGSRISAKAFQKLSTAEKKGYLKQFPRSSHWQFMPKSLPAAPADKNASKKPKASDDSKKAKKGADDVKALPAPEGKTLARPRKPRSKELVDADARNKKDLAEITTTRKHHVAKKPNFTKLIQNADGVYAVDGRESNAESTGRLRAERRAVNSSRDEARQSVRHNLTKESVGAARKVTGDDMARAADNLDENADEVIEQIHEENGDKPFWKRDLEAMGKIMNGEKVNPGGMNNAMTFLTIASRYALMVGGVAAISMGAAPVAMHVARSLFDTWGEFNSATAASDKEVETEETEEPEVDEDEEARKIQMFAVVYRAITDQIRHLDVEEMQEFLEKNFKNFTPDEEEEGEEEDEEFDDEEEEDEDLDDEDLEGDEDLEDDLDE